MDLSKAFDSIRPSLAVHALMHVGLCPKLAAFLAEIWNNQRRWLMVGKATAEAPARGARCLPQGDPWAPLALQAVLAGPQAQVSKYLKQAVSDEKVAGNLGAYAKQFVYLDDRHILGSDLNLVMRAVMLWESSTAALGLQAKKLGVLFLGPRRQEALNEWGLKDAKRDTLHRRRTNAMFEDAVQRAKRLMATSVKFTTKCRFLRAAVVLKASRGLWIHPLNQAVCGRVQAAMKRCLGRGLATASLALIRLLAGHWMDIHFISGLYALRHFVGAAAATPTPRRRRLTGKQAPPKAQEVRPATGSRETRLNRWLRTYGARTDLGGVLFIEDEQPRHLEEACHIIREERRSNQLHSSSPPIDATPATSRSTRAGRRTRPSPISKGRPSTSTRWMPTAGPAWPVGRSSTPPTQG